MTKPVAGYRTQAEAVEALLGQGMTPMEIARCIGADRASVDVAISRYRKRVGAQSPQMDGEQDEGIWALPGGQRRVVLARRAAAGARETLEAAGL